MTDTTHHKDPIVYWHTAAAICSVIILALVVVVVFDRTHKNREAIEKGCILLNNAIIRSSQAPPSPATKILIEAILSQAPQATVVRYKAASHERPPSIITLVDCHAIAQHPETINPERPPTPAG